nr:hypothetical protein CPGR_04915 [Mycolicibacterium malmesburyense]
MQSHRGRADRPRQFGRPVLAAPFAPTGAVRRERAHGGGAGMLGADRNRSTTGTHRRRGAGVAGARDRATSDRLAPQGRRRSAPDHRRTGRGVCRWPATGLRGVAPQAASPAGTADLSIPAASVLAKDLRHPCRRGQQRRCVRASRQREGTRLGRHRLHQQAVSQVTAVVGRPCHLRDRRRPRGDVCGDGARGGRRTGAGARRHLLRTDHPAREGFSRGPADLAAGGRW